MTTTRILGLFSALVLSSSFSFAQNSNTPPPAQKTDSFQLNVQKSEEKKPVVLPDKKLDNMGKLEIIRGMTAELGYARKPFPFGKTGLTINAQGQLVKPTDEQLQEMLGVYGPAVKTGERAHITAVKFKDKSIIFEINGGPEKKKKWYEHIQVAGAGGAVQPGQPDDSTNIHGSYLELVFDKYVPQATPQQLKQILDPIINFSAKSATEAYLDTIPPKAKQAIADHKVLVGMNREMVTYAKGRPPQKYRDKDGDTDYEEWIYGAPPQDVEFIRFVGDEVVRVETMKVDGTKMVRTEREIMVQPEQPEVAQQQGQPGPAGPPQTPGQSQPAATGTEQSSGPRPTLRRPGEEVGQQPTPQGRPTQTGPNYPDPNPPQPPGSGQPPN
ncbi:MAG TPA: hypothetical protein VG897_16025 [Terriglobales bacterium]|nr:hypothetical protein [Terriglobales bacterium]